MSTTNDPMIPATTDLGTEPADRSARGERYQVVAMFETLERARDARERLLEEGVSASDMDLVNRDADTAHSNFEYDRSDEGFWGAVKRFFVPDADAPGYAEGLKRGHAMLTVRPPANLHDRVVEILETFDPIDFQARQEEWRKTGWTGGAPLTAAGAALGTGVAATGLPTGNVAATNAGNIGTDTTSTATTTSTAATTGQTAAPTGTLGAASDRATEVTGTEAIPVVEEDVRIGKRAIDRGRVRVRSYVVERPVEENVTLHDERIDVERRAVDRPAGTVPDEAFRERTIEVTATGEEAVVQKDARVVEEVVVRKDAQERTETVRDTVRKTEVEVEDTRTGEKTRPTER